MYILNKIYIIVTILHMLATETFSHEIKIGQLNGRIGRLMFMMILDNMI